MKVIKPQNKYCDRFTFEIGRILSLVITGFWEKQTNHPAWNNQVSLISLPLITKSITNNTERPFWGALEVLQSILVIRYNLESGPRQVKVREDLFNPENKKLFQKEKVR